MKRQRGSEDITFGAAVLMLAVVLVLWLVFDPMVCHSKWARSGFKVQWGPVQGCMLEVQPGKWIPEDRYREMIDEPRH